MRGERNKETKKGNNEETSNVDRRKEIMERKLKLAAERNTRVVTVDAPLSAIFAASLRQFDMAYSGFKRRLGEHNGVSYSEGEEIIRRSQRVAVEFSELTSKICDLIGFKYYPPRGLEMLTDGSEAAASQER